MYENLEHRSSRDQAGSWWSELIVAHHGRVHEAYAFLTAIADQIQLDGKTFGEATTAGIGSFSQLLAPHPLMSVERQVGLYGELLLLEHLLVTNRLLDIRTWKGAEKAEHDFVFSDFTLEVKSTLSEGRVHRITSFEQLVPVLDRPLVFVSIQLTDAT